MSVDDRHQAAWRAMQNQRQRDDVDTRLPLQGGGGGDNFGGMEVRIAKLEVAVDALRAEQAKLSAMPVDLAKLTERVDHLPTRTDVDAAIDRAASRTQRTIATASAAVAIIGAVVTYLVKVAG